MATLEDAPKRHAHRLRRALLFYLAVVIGGTGLALIQVRGVLTQEIDQRLLAAAVAVPSMLAPDFHDRAIAAGAVSAPEDRANIAALTRYAHAAGLSFVYSLILHEGRPRLTASSATLDELAAGDEVSYFAPFDEIADDFKDRRPDQAPRFLTHTDRWGSFRVALVPRVSPRGRPYVVAAELRLAELRPMLLGCMVRLLLFATVLLLASLPMVHALTSAVRRSNQQLEQRVAERTRELRRIATTDELTGVANRKELLAQLDHELALGRRHHIDGTLMMLDVDHFKAVNDRYGHPGGDRVLMALADCVRGRLRISDRFGRLGGEEFAIVLTHSGLLDAGQVAEQIRADLQAMGVPLRDGREVRITVSIGIVAFSECAWEREHLIHVGDERLYRAKDLGRNQVVCNDSSHPDRPDSAEIAD